MSQAYEVNFDGLVGPTHNYAGLSYGNVASTSHRAMVSNPREAALQGLRKMKALADLGLKQAVLPPQERPDVGTLRRLGFAGASDAEVVAKAAREAPEILAACFSASSMWTANAATVSPSADTEDGKVHFTPANLNSKFHRSIEPELTGRALKAIFTDPQRFAHHDPLPSGAYFGDEGAANHTRFCRSGDYGSRGLELFVFGRYAFRAGAPEPLKYPARQTCEASAAVARLHRLRPESVVFAQQNPAAIDSGVFHNDVASVGNQNVLFCHEQAFLDSDKALGELKRKYQALCGEELRLVRVPAGAVSMEDAVRSYLFNSQLITLPDGGGMALVAPLECEETPSVKRYLSGMLSDPACPIREAKFFDLRQSMRNGGGPACLRLRVTLTSEEIAASNPKAHMSAALFEELSAWARKHYRDRLSADDLLDPKLIDESRAALDELTRILNLGSIYPFQLGSSRRPA